LFIQRPTVRHTDTSTEHSLLGASVEIVMLLLIKILTMKR